VRSSGSSMFMWLITSLADVVEENIGYFALHLVAEPLYDMIWSEWKNGCSFAFCCYNASCSALWISPLWNAL
jgi:hypothetical protein